MGVEYRFELALAAHLEREGRLVSRQLGAQIAGRRIVDLVCVEPGVEFDQRAALTAETIPPLAIESDVGSGEARYWKDAFDCHPSRAETAVERAVECGFFERERRNGRTYVRQVSRYPDWVDQLIAIENKPDLASPGDLERQLRTDVSFAVFDRVVLATASHVTGAHRNRIPDEVGIWQFDPETDERTVLREATLLDTGRSGIEICDWQSDKTDIRVTTPPEKQRVRRRIAERAYGKGWRTYDLPRCANINPDEDGLPYCAWHGQVVRPATDCGPECGGYEPADSPAIDRERLRDGRTPWQANPEGLARTQVGLSRYADSSK